MEPLSEAVKTNNSVIVFFVCLTIAAVVAGPKLIRAFSAASKAKAEAENQKSKVWIDREREILKVIEKNAEANSQISQALTGIKTFFENTTSQQKDIFDNLKEGHEDLKDGQKEILCEVRAINAKLGGGRAE